MAAFSGGREAKARKSNQTDAWPRTIAAAVRRTACASGAWPRITERFARMARRYFGRNRKYAPPTPRASGRTARRGRLRATNSVAGNQRRDVAEARARTRRLRLAIFSCTRLS